MWQRSESVSPRSKHQSKHQSKHPITCGASLIKPRRRRRDDPLYPSCPFYPLYLSHLSIFPVQRLNRVSVRASAHQSIGALFMRYRALSYTIIYYQCAIVKALRDGRDMSYCTYFTLYACSSTIMYRTLHIHDFFLCLSRMRPALL